MRISFKLFHFYVLLLVFIFSSSYANCVGVVCVEEFEVSESNWEVPLGIEVIIAEAWGAGGAGGSTATGGGPPQGAGGGAGGQYARSLFNVNSGQLFDIEVAGITIHPGTANTNGPDGTSSSISNSTDTLVLAQGGQGGRSQGNGRVGGVGSSAGGIGDIVFAGGSGGTGETGGGGSSGGGGGGAGSEGIGGSASTEVAGIGTSEQGGDGGEGVSNNVNGNPGLNYGGGGGGARRNIIGGSGAPGFVRLTYFNFSNAFISQWDTTLGDGSNTITLPTVTSGSYNFYVFWGDGNFDHITSWNQAEISHTYDSSGTYAVRIIGEFEGWNFDGPNNAHREKIINVERWGPLVLGNSGGYFRGAININFNATDAPDLSGTTNMNNAFRGATNFNSNIGHWDVSQVTTMAWIFGGASSFNNGGSSDINSWNVGRVGSLFRAFSGSSFNQPLNNWDVRNVTTMDFTFGNSAFNQDISSWDVSSVNNFRNTFQNTPFNQDISSWDVSSATDMFSMFRDASSFNSDISNWSVQNVENMENMFQGATVFNQNLACWNVTNIGNDPPDNFASGSALSPPNFPNWGTDGTSCYTPQISIISPLNGEVFNSNVLLNISIGENVGPFLDTIWFSINGGSNITYTQAVELDREEDLLLGFNTIEIWANSTFGDVGFNTTTFINNPSPIIDNLALHLDASVLRGVSNNSELTNWSDISGNSNDALEWGGSVGNPLYVQNQMNNLPVVRYTPSDGLLIPFDSSLSFPSEFTIFAVVNLEGRTSGTNDIRTIISRELSFSNRNYWLVHWDNRWQGRISPGTPTVESNDISSLNPTILTYQATGSQLQLYVDGILQSSTASYSSINTPTAPVGIGRQADDARGWDGDIAEILVFSNSLTTSQINQINGYLQIKWVPVPLEADVTLIEPTNNSKVFSPNNRINLSWEIEDSNFNDLTCNIFVNSVLEDSVPCENNSITSYELLVLENEIEWFVEVQNIFQTTVTSLTNNFNAILQNHQRIRKELISQGDSIYLTNITLSNLMNNPSPSSVIFDFVGNSFNSESFSPFLPPDSFTTLTTSPFQGELLQYNINSQNPLEEFDFFYSVANVQFNSSLLLDEFIIGFK